jgi:hypothetical protein
VLAGIGLVAILALANNFTKLNLPIFAIVLCYLFVCLVMISMRLDRGKLLIYCSAYIFLAFGVAELFLKPFKPANDDYELVFKDLSSGKPIQYYHISDPDLGYANRPGIAVSATKRSVKDGAIVYDVKYSIDERGLRKTQLKNGNPLNSDNAVWFFGDSFMFGEGVNDEDTLPQKFSTLSGHCAANFGVTGYGPHEMLRAMEIDRPEKLNLKKPMAIVYLITPEYVVSRAAGLAPWDQKGPRYEIINGEPKYVGSFNDTRSDFDRVASNSETYTAVFKKFPAAVDSEPDRERFSAIVLKTKELSLRKYHAPFVAILWDVYIADQVKAQWIAQNLKQNQIPTLQLSNALPSLNDADDYIPKDWHPNGKAHGLVARELNSFLGPYLTSKASDVNLSRVRSSDALCH